MKQCRFTGGSVTFERKGENVIKDDDPTRISSSYVQFGKGTRFPSSFEF